MTQQIEILNKEIFFKKIEILEVKVIAEMKI